MALKTKVKTSAKRTQAIVVRLGTDGSLTVRAEMVPLGKSAVVGVFRKGTPPDAALKACDRMHAVVQEFGGYLPPGSKLWNLLEDRSNDPGVGVASVDVKALPPRWDSGTTPRGRRPSKPMQKALRWAQEVGYSRSDGSMVPMSATVTVRPRKPIVGTVFVTSSSKKW
jgi:hypothetical protein